MIWNPTDQLLPHIDQVVLGWWNATALRSVVYRGDGNWHLPGYLFAERRAAPQFWADLPEPPDEQERAA